MFATAELISQSDGVAPGQTVWLAVRQKIQKGWHTYWRNPGDAGQPTSIRWSLPAGWRAGSITWPAPRRLPVGPVIRRSSRVSNPSRWMPVTTPVADIPGSFTVSPIW